MAEKGKRFNIPTPLFDRKAFALFEAVAVNEYRKITFDKSNPRMADDRPFPKYTKAYEKRKKANKLRRQNSSYANSTAPYVVGDLANDTKSSFSVKKDSIFINWSSHGYKLQHLRDNGRILTSREHPINPKVIKKLMPNFNKELKRIMPKGKHTITIGKKK